MLAHFIESKPFQCGYFKDQKSLFEEYLLEDMSEVEFEYLLAHGMRHFGDTIFVHVASIVTNAFPFALGPKSLR